MFTIDNSFVEFCEVNEEGGIIAKKADGSEFYFDQFHPQYEQVKGGNFGTVQIEHKPRGPEEKKPNMNMEEMQEALEILIEKSTLPELNALKARLLSRKNLDL